MADLSDALIDFCAEHGIAGAVIITIERKDGTDQMFVNHAFACEDDDSAAKMFCDKVSDILDEQVISELAAIEEENNRLN